MSIEQKRYVESGRRMGWAEAIEAAEARANSLMTPRHSGLYLDGVDSVVDLLHVRFVDEFPGIDPNELTGDF